MARRVGSSERVPDASSLGAVQACVMQRMIRVPAALGRGFIALYRYTLSPLIGFHCRHLPTCSEYADQALAKFGLWAGGWMTLARLLRCHPWGSAGLDFLPEHLPSRARW